MPPHKFVDSKGQLKKSRPEFATLLALCRPDHRIARSPGSSAARATIGLTASRPRTLSHASCRLLFRLLTRLDPEFAERSTVTSSLPPQRSSQDSASTATKPPTSRPIDDRSARTTCPASGLCPLGTRRALITEGTGNQRKTASKEWFTHRLNLMELKGRPDTCADTYEEYLRFTDRRFWEGTARTEPNGSDKPCSRAARFAAARTAGSNQSPSIAEPSQALHAAVDCTACRCRPSRNLCRPLMSALREARRSRQRRSSKA